MHHFIGVQGECVAEGGREGMYDSCVGRRKGALDCDSDACYVLKLTLL